MLDHTIVVERWRCQGKAERYAAWYLSEYVATPIDEVPRQEVSDIFAIQSSWSPALREEVWMLAWGVDVEEREIGGETIEVILINKVWMVELWACRVLGCCDRDPVPCLQLAPYGSPNYVPQPPPCPPPD